MKLVPWSFVDPAKHLWTDLPDGSARAAGFPEPQRDLLLDFIRDGYVVTPDGIALDDCDMLLAAIRQGIRDPATTIRVRHQIAPREWRIEPATEELLLRPTSRLPRPHHHLPETLALSLAPDIVDFLATSFDDDVVAFNSIFFEFGSTQPAHNDTAYVVVSPPNRLIASWIALEDVLPGSGELFVYTGSHRLDEQFFDTGSKEMSQSDEVFGKYGSRLEQLMEEAGFQREVWRPKKGQVLFWNPNLIHGGMPISNPPRTRRSLVTHYCPLGSVVPEVRDGQHDLIQYSDRGWYTRPKALAGR